MKVKAPLSAILLSAMFVASACSTHEPQKKTFEAEPDPKYTEEGIYISDGWYYPVHVTSDSAYYTDNLTYISDVNGKWFVSLLSNVNSSTLSSEAKMVNPEILSKDALKSEDTKSGVQCAAKMVSGDKALIVTCTDEPVVFATVLEGLLSMDLKEVRQRELQEKQGHTESLSGVPAEDESSDITVKVGFGKRTVSQYEYDDGSLSVALEVRKFNDAYQELCMRLITAANENVLDACFAGNGKYYAEIGEYTAAAYSLNYNTTAVCFGKGFMARQNVRYFMLRQEEGEW